MSVFKRSLNMQSSFIIEHLCPDIIKIGIDVPLRVSPLNFYIYKLNSNHWVLFDTGYSDVKCREAIDETIGRFNLDYSELKAVFLTHDHADHCGQACELEEKNKDLKIVVGSEDAFHTENYFDDTSLDPQKARYFSLHNAPEKFTRRILRAFPFFRKRKQKFHSSFKIPIHSVERLDFSNKTIIAVSTPGHTLGHLCYYLEDKKILISGDHILPGILPQISLRPGWHNFDQWELYRNSLNLLKRFDIKMVLPGHGEIIKDINCQIEKNILEMNKRQDNILSIISDKDDLTAYDIAQHLASSNNESFDLWIVWGEVIAVIHSLEKKGLIKLTTIDDNIIIKKSSSL